MIKLIPNSVFEKELKEIEDSFAMEIYFGHSADWSIGCDDMLIEIADLMKVSPHKLAEEIAENLKSFKPSEEECEKYLASLTKNYTE